MAQIISDKAVLYAFKVESGRPWYLLLRRSAAVEFPGVWESVVGEPRNGENCARAAIRAFVEQTSLDPVSLWAVEHVESHYDAHSDEVRLMPCFAALVSGEIRLGTRHDASRWFSSTEVANALGSAAKRASMDAIHHDVGAPVARGMEPDPRLRVV